MTKSLFFIKSIRRKNTAILKIFEIASKNFILLKIRLINIAKTRTKKTIPIKFVKNFSLKL